MDEFRGHYPTNTELAAAAGAVNDLGRFVDYAALLGSATVAADAVAKALTLAVQWRAERDSSIDWESYAKTQDAIAWKSALAMLDDVRPVFLLAMSKNAALATQYPWLAKLLGASKAAAKTANATKAKRAKEATTNAAASSKAAAKAIASAAQAAANSVADTAAAAAAASVGKATSAAAGDNGTTGVAASPTTAAKAVTPGA